MAAAAATHTAAAAAVTSGGLKSKIFIARFDDEAKALRNTGEPPQQLPLLLPVAVAGLVRPRPGKAFVSPGDAGLLGPPELVDGDDVAEDAQA